MSFWQTAETRMKKSFSPVFFEADQTVFLYDDLTYSLHCKFGLSEQKATHLAGDIYKVIDI